MICVDSNVWIYYFDSRLDEHAAVRPEMDRLLQSGETVLVNSFVQLEVVHYLVKQLENAEEHVESYLGLEGLVVHPVGPREVHESTRVLLNYDESGVGGRNASILNSMRDADVPELWTHDRALERLGAELDWLQVFDPVG